MRPKKIRAEKVMHTRKGWKHADDVKRLRIMMASVAAAAVVFIAAAGVVIWMMLQEPCRLYTSSGHSMTDNTTDNTMDTPKTGDTTPVSYTHLIPTNP